METVEYTTDDEGLNLVLAEKAIKEGTVVVAIQVTSDLKHLIAKPPHGVGYKVTDGVLRIYTHSANGPIREYGSWLFVEEIAEGPGRTRPRGGTIW